MKGLKKKEKKKGLRSFFFQTKGRKKRPQPVDLKRTPRRGKRKEHPISSLTFQIHLLPFGVNGRTARLEYTKVRHQGKRKKNKGSTG